MKLADVNAVKRRFLAINRERLRRAQDTLRERQRDFLDLLPLLFHTNHMLLPGFISTQTPMGISDYSPDSRALDAAKKITRNLAYRRKALRRYDIFSIFLMGSSGTIGHSGKSDFDIWICHQPDIAGELLDELRGKAVAIEQWAAQLDLEVHFFLMDAVHFKAGGRGELSKEGSGSAQHSLLLEEFYRTGLLLAGRYPAWWLVPPGEEDGYDDYLVALKDSYAVRETEYIDFGGIPRIPAEEFFGAALWQLFKGIDSPYKSVLKLLLMEVYAHEYPASDLLCQRFKKAIYEGETSLNRLDPYIMLYAKIEEHLTKTGEKERLELFRRSFYFKVNEKLSVTRAAGRGNWRHDLMKDLTHAWEWDDAYIEMLDARPSWKINRVLRERRILTNELTQVYRFLSDFAHEHARLAMINQKDMNILGRKLYAAFERKAGKVEIVNRGISQNLQESHLTFWETSFDPGQENWALYIAPLNSIESGGVQPIRRAHSVIELIAWCHFNEMMDGATILGLSKKKSDLTSKELRALFNRFQQIFPNTSENETSMEELSRSSTMVTAALFVNVGVDPMASHTRQGRHYMSNKTDALSYGGMGENLALTFDLVVMTSWKEVLTFRYSGMDGLMSCIAEYIRWNPTAKGSPRAPFSIHCFSVSHGVTIERRIEELFDGIKHCFYREAPAREWNYVLSVGHLCHYVLWGERDNLRWRRIESYPELLTFLGGERTAYVHVEVDGHALRDTPLPQIFSVNRPYVIQMFYQTGVSYTDIYVLDECGSLYCQTIESCESAALINQFTLFFDAVIRRRCLLDFSAAKPFDAVEIYQIRKDELGGMLLVKQEALRQKQLKGYLSVQVVANRMSGDKLAFTIYCGDHEFSSLTHGNNLFREVASQVLKLRRSGERYPIYITDVDLPPSASGSEPERLPTIHFLNHKKYIEGKLNEALAEMEDIKRPALSAANR